MIVDATAYAQAVEDAVKASAAYYAGGTSVLDDETYDRLVRGIAAWEAAHPDQVLPDSPTGKVAGGAVEGDVPHTVAMLSLDNVFSPEEFTAWTASPARRISHRTARFSVEPKLDGLAIAARYTRGRLTRLITRGDGTAGEDVSHAIGTIEGLPLELTEPVTVEVRGEVLMTTANSPSRTSSVREAVPVRSRSAAVRQSRIVRAWRSRVRPAGVSRTPSGRRSNKAVPALRSRAAAGVRPPTVCSRAGWLLR
ncbi:hypothetical protein BFF78_00120 [Streptomyces fodineus]|uniref:NAD-dependent DNA ligase N-terminal domain-containing protein n=1 Tax=Streptomyces fodineus TaxID=1904616 RepID=A0A1D7Y297_9ACTN|nr:hypothetical protein BFF78_00120 [Streptomyces fodineus]